MDTVELVLSKTCFFLCAIVDERNWQWKDIYYFPFTRLALSHQIVWWGTHQGGPKSRNYKARVGSETRFFYWKTKRGTKVQNNPRKQKSSKEKSKAPETGSWWSHGEDKTRAVSQTANYRAAESTLRSGSSSSHLEHESTVVRNILLISGTHFVVTSDPVTVNLWRN